MSLFAEKPASNMSISKRKPVYGIGINDADYITNQTINGTQATCPIYQTWRSMLFRCYDNSFQKRQPTYAGCSVAKEWLIFSKFRAWMKTQDWEGKQLDKDILVPGNKGYSPEACIFVSSQINVLITDNEALRGECPRGVYFHKARGKYSAQCSVNGKNKHIGSFTTIKAAEDAYLEFKTTLILELASTQEPRLMEALIRHAELIKSKSVLIDCITGNPRP